MPWLIYVLLYMHTIVGKSEHAYPHIMSLATTKSGSFDASLLDAEDIYMSGEMRTEEENFSWRKQKTSSILFFQIL